MSLGSMMNVNADVLLLTQPKTSTMGAKRIWTDTGINLWCRFENISFRDAEKWKQQGVVGTHLWFFASDPALNVLTNALLFDGDRYEIRNVENVANMNRVWEVVTEMVRAAAL